MMLKKPTIHNCESKKLIQEENYKMSDWYRMALLDTLDNFIVIKMLFEKPKHDYVFVGAFWILTIILTQMLYSVQPLDMKNPGTPPAILQDLPTIVYSIFGAYIGLFVTVLTYRILGPKLIISAKNLSIYGIKSFVMLVLIFADLVGVIAMEHDFVGRIFHLNNQLPSWQEGFVYCGFPIIGLYLTWNFRNQKIEYKGKAAI